ncbi:MAG TPA: nucleotide exchange factor GrpE [Thermoanaerobaculia bacterium]|jgi:molecular chaperone GrpE (heat shock protein)
MEKETTVPEISAALDELADGMLDIVQRLANLERQSQESSAAIAELRRYTQDAVNHHSRTLEALRAEAAGERKLLALRSTFEPVASALDSLELLRQGLDGRSDQRAYGQLTAAAATLANVLTALGFERFDVAAGEPFDPNRMQCFGYAEGEPGLVLQALQPGYTAASIVVRPASVLIAAPTTP